MNRVVVLGGAGFIGRSLVAKLSSLPNLEIISFGRSFPPELKLPNPQAQSRVTFHEGDFSDLENLKQITQPGDVIFDLVTSSVPYSSMQSPIEEVKEHVFSHVQFIELACKVGVKQLIFTSSGGSVYGERILEPISEDVAPQPMSPHAISKVTIEHFLQYFSKFYHVPHLIFRLSNPYGPEQHAKEGFGIIPILFSHIQHHKQPTLFNHGDLVRDFIFIDDLIDAMILPLHQPAQHDLYNIGSGVGTSLKELWNEIKDITGTDLEPLYQPKRPIDVESIILNTQRFSHEFHWQPQISLHTGLERAWQKFQQDHRG